MKRELTAICLLAALTLTVVNLRKKHQVLTGLEARILTRLNLVGAVPIQVFPDGHTVLSKRRKSDTFEILETDLKSSRALALDESSNSQISLHVSASQSRLFFHERNENGYGFNLLDLNAKVRCKLPVPEVSSAFPPVAWSPDGRFLAWIAERKKHSTVEMMPSPDCSQSTVISVGETYPRVPVLRWLPKSDGLIYAGKVPGAVTIAMLGQEPRSARLKVTPETLVENFLPAPDGRVAVQVHDEKSLFQELLVLDQSGKELSRTRLVAPLDWTLQAWSNDGKFIFLTHRISVLESSIVRLDPVSLAMRTITDLPGKSVLQFISPDSRSGIVWNVALTDSPKLIELSLDDVSGVSNSLLDSRQVTPLVNPEIVTDEQHSSCAQSLFWKAPQWRGKTFIIFQPGSETLDNPWGPLVGEFLERGIAVALVGYKPVEGVVDASDQKLLCARAAVHALSQQERFSPEDMILFGNSVSASVAAQVAIALPQRAKGLVMVGAFLNGIAPARRSQIPSAIVSFEGTEDDELDRAWSGPLLNKVFGQFVFWRLDSGRYLLKGEPHTIMRNSSWAGIVAKILSLY